MVGSGSLNLLMVAYSSLSVGRFCVVTPRTGARLLQAGDEKLLQLAKECESAPSLLNCLLIIL